MKLISALLVALAAILPSPSPASSSQNSSSPAKSAAYLYRVHCRECHGVDGKSNTAKGKLNHARNLSDPAWQDEVSDERIFNSIMNGRKVRGDMPAFGKRISDAEADSLVTFVRNLKK
jgi:mono/diheme cytochrome c family protein